MQVGITHGGLKISRILVRSDLTIKICGLTEGDEFYVDPTDDRDGAINDARGNEFVSEPSAFFYDKESEYGGRLEVCDVRAFGDIAAKVARILSEAPRRGE